MIDQKNLSDKQISEFLFEYKNRFRVIPTNGMPGKIGYSASINRIDVNSSIQIFIPERFPYEPPIFYSMPPFSNPIIEQSGRIVDDCLKKWNVNSTLKNCVLEILSKLENTNNLNNPKAINSNQVQDIMIDDSNSSKELRDDLSKKTVEELLYIYHNPEHYVKILTQRQRTENEALFNEVLIQSGKFNEKKAQYEAFKQSLDESKKQYMEMENKLNDLYNQKAMVDSRFSVEALIEEMRKNIDENYHKPKMKLVNELMNKRITFDEFQREFRPLSMQYHYNSIIKDKMNLYK